MLAMAGNDAARPLLPYSHRLCRAGYHRHARPLIRALRVAVSSSWIIVVVQPVMAQEAELKSMEPVITLAQAVGRGEVDIGFCPIMRNDARKVFDYALTVSNRTAQRLGMGSFRADDVAAVQKGNDAYFRAKLPHGSEADACRAVRDDLASIAISLTEIATASNGNRRRCRERIFARKRDLRLWLLRADSC